MRVASLVLPGGIGMAIVGLYLIIASGLLLGQYRCDAGPGCAGPYYFSMSELWTGIAVLCVGVVSMTLASLQLIKKQFRK